MYIMIDIPESIYETIKEEEVGNVVYKAIKNGILLSKGHGKIVDANRVLENGDNWEVETALMQTEAIIEADKP